MKTSLQVFRLWIKTRDFAVLLFINMIALKSEYYMPPAVEWDFNEMVAEVERLRQANQNLILENKELQRRVTVLEHFVEVSIIL